MGSASAAQRPEARWPANDASGIRAAPGCGGVSVDASVTSHGAAPTLAHVGCVVVCLMEPGRVSQLQSWRVASRKAKVQPCPSTKDWEPPPPPAPQPTHPACRQAPSFTDCPGGPGIKFPWCLVLQNPLLGRGPGSAHAAPLSTRDPPTAASLTTPSSHLPCHFSTRLTPSCSPWRQLTAAEPQLLGKLGPSERLP